MDPFSEKTSLGRNLLIGFQHVLVMFPGTIAVILILASAAGLDSEMTALLISANLLTSGITILIQVVGLGKYVGSRYPIVMGAAFAPLAPMILISDQYGFAALFGAVIASGVIIFVISFFMDRILSIFTPVVTGTFITLVGVGLAPTAIQDIAGGVGSSTYASVVNLLLGFGVLLFIVIMERFGKGIWKAMSLLLGILGGTVIAAALGMVDPEPVMNANMFQLVMPFHFGAPQFEIGSILIMTIFCLINTIQCVGVFSVVDEIAGTKTSDDTKIKGVRAQAAAQIITGVFNSVPPTMFNENVSLMNLTKVKSRSSVITAGIMLLFLGISPKISAVITMVPKPVLGGATLALFGTITASGMSVLSKVDFFKNNNFTIIGVSMAVGAGATFEPGIFDQLPQTLRMVCSNGLFMASISAIILNLLFNGRKGLAERKES